MKTNMRQFSVDDEIEIARKPLAEQAQIILERRERVARFRQKAFAVPVVKSKPIEEAPLLAVSAEPAVPIVCPFGDKCAEVRFRFELDLQLARQWSPMERIKRIVAGHYGIKMALIEGATRQARVVLVRQVIMYLARELTPLSMPHIARRLGDRDHTTVLHGYRKIARLISRDADLAETIETLRKMIEDQPADQMVPA